MMIAQQSELWKNKPNQQPISKHEFFLLFRKVLGRELDKGDEDWFSGCATVEQFMYNVLHSNFFQAIALEQNPIVRANVCEFYTCLRCGLTWDPHPGFDVYGAFKYQEEIKAGKIEVKHGGEIQGHQWHVQATGREKEIKADVMVFIGMPGRFNPCEGTMLVIPSSAYEEEVKQQLEKYERLPEIYISKSRINNNTKRQNKWYEYELMDHTRLKEQLSKYVHGVPIILSRQPHQFSLF